MVEGECLGKHRCEVKAQGFGDPCHKRTKVVAAAVTCNESTTTPGVAKQAWRPPSATPGVSAWVVEYPFEDSDSYFDSSSPELNQVQK